MPEWRNTDPREDFYEFDRVDIVIVRPSLSGGSHLEAGIGYAEMEYGYNISTTFDNHRYVGEDEKWDPAWFWVIAP
jgi:hypothetical protein